MTTKKLICALIMIAVCGSLLSGCAYNPETVMTVDGEDVSAGIYLYYQYTTVQMALQDYNEDGLSGKKFLEEGTAEDKPAAEWIAEKTQEEILSFMFIESEFDRLGLKFSDSELSYYEYMAQSNWSAVSGELSRNGISYESYLEAMLNSNKKSMVMQKLYDEEGEKEISEKAKIAFFDEHFGRIDVLEFPMLTYFGYPHDAETQKQIVAVAQEMLDMVNGGATLEEAFLEHWEEVLELAGEETIDEYGESLITPELFVDMVVLDSLINDEGREDEDEFAVEAVRSEIDKYRLFVKEDEVIAIYRRVDFHEDDSWEGYKSSILNMMAAGPFEDYIKESIAKMVVELDEKAMQYYGLDKVRLYQ